MIEPGWRRRNDVCPQCHMPGRIAQRNKTEGMEEKQAADAGSLSVRYHYLQMSVCVDICDNCGVLYAYKAERQ